MSLQFIIGSSGIGKTHYACEQIIRESMENPQHLYYIIVPEQFTMQTQKNVVEMHPGKGILNIDVLSFQRLAYRIFEETGGAREVLLDDTGKSMVLQKLVQQHRKNLPYLGSQMNKPGYLDEVKSLISEFMQYDIREEELQDMLGKTGGGLSSSYENAGCGCPLSGISSVSGRSLYDRRRRDGRFEKAHSFFR